MTGRFLRMFESFGKRYFDHITDPDALKKEYRRLTFLHHPDKGGTNAEMQEINAQHKSAQLRIALNGTQGGGPRGQSNPNDRSNRDSERRQREQEQARRNQERRREEDSARERRRAAEQERARRDQEQQEGARRAAEQERARREQEARDSARRAAEARDREQQERRQQEEHRRQREEARQARNGTGRQQQQRDTGRRPRRTPEERAERRRAAERAYLKAIQDAKAKLDRMNRASKEDFDLALRQNPSNFDGLEFMYQEELRNNREYYERAVAQADRMRNSGAF
jgi:hypothetical protein